MEREVERPSDVGPVYDQAAAAVAAAAAAAEGVIAHKAFQSN